MQVKHRKMALVIDDAVVGVGQGFNCACTAPRVCRLPCNTLVVELKCVNQEQRVIPGFSRMQELRQYCDRLLEADEERIFSYL